MRRGGASVQSTATATRTRDERTDERTNKQTVAESLLAATKMTCQQHNAKRGTRSMWPDPIDQPLRRGVVLRVTWLHSTPLHAAASRTSRTRFRPRAVSAPRCTRSRSEQAVSARPRSLRPLRTRASVQPPLTHIVRRRRLEGRSTHDDTADAYSLHAQPRQAHLAIADSLVTSSPPPTGQCLPLSHAAASVTRRHAAAAPHRSRTAHASCAAASIEHCSFPAHSSLLPSSSATLAVPDRRS